VVGQLAEADRVAEAVVGAEAVISALGPDLSRKATGMPLVDGTRSIVTAMEEAGVDRYAAWLPLPCATSATSATSAACAASSSR
jgi:putative NAD(P)-binding protein